MAEASAIAELRQRRQRQQEIERSGRPQKVGIRPFRFNDKRTRETKNAVRTDVTYESIRRVVVKEASVQTLPISDEVLFNINWDDFTDATTDLEDEVPIPKWKRKKPSGAVQSDAAPLVSEYQEVNASVQTDPLDDEDLEVEVGTSLLNPRVFAVWKAVAEAPPNILDNSAIEVDFESFDAAVFRPSEPFPELTDAEATSLCSDARYQDLLARYHDALDGLVPSTSSASPVLEAFQRLLRFIITSSSGSSGSELRFSELPHSVYEQDEYSCFSLDRHSRTSRVETSLWSVSLRSKEAPATSSSGKKRRFVADEDAQPRKKARSDSPPAASNPSPSTAPIAISAPASSQAGTSAVSVGGSKPLHSSLSRPIWDVLQETPSRRNLMGVFVDGTTASFSCTDRTGSIMSHPVPLSDPRFVSSVVRLAAADRGIVGYESCIVDGPIADVRSSAPPPEERNTPLTREMRLGFAGMEYQLGPRLDESLASEGHTFAYAASSTHPHHPSPSASSTPPADRFVVKLAWQPASSEREDILLRQARESDPEDVPPVYLSATPMRLSDPCSPRAMILPGGVNRLYRDLEFRIMVLGPFSDGENLSEHLSKVRSIVEERRRVGRDELEDDRGSQQRRHFGSSSSGWPRSDIAEHELAS